MRKKIIYAVLMTVLVTSFTGCGKAQDTDAAEVIMAEMETSDSDLTAETQAAVDTLLPTETGKPVVTETATPTPKPVATKKPETTATPKPTATATPKATATSKPATTAGSGTTVAANTTSTGKTGTTATAAPAEKETPAATAKPAAPTPEPTAAPCNHNFVKSYWNSEPTCNGGGYYNLICTICGANGGDGTEPALPHTPATRVEVDATYCDEHGVRVIYCTSCGNELGRDGFDGTEHEWTTGTYEAWDEDTHTVVEKEVTYCSRCHAQR